MYEYVTLHAAPPQRRRSEKTLAPLKGAIALLNQERVGERSGRGEPAAPWPALPPLSMADALCVCCTLPG